MFCGKCGTQQIENAAFCGKCGAPMGGRGSARPVAPQPPSRKPPANKKVVMGALCALLILIFAVGAVWFFVLPENGEEDIPAAELAESPTPIPTPDQPTTPMPTQAPMPTQTPTPIPTPEPTPEPTEPEGFVMEAIDAIIADRAEAWQVAVAVLDLETGETNATASGDIPFVASGFYAPLYNIALSRDNAVLRQTAETMMATMDNTAANSLISSLGGLSQVNSILRDRGFPETTFGRNFGDVEASRRGQENFTTAREAALILAEVYDSGGHARMNANLAGAGISLPAGATVHAHRGTGIGGADNVFAVVVTPQMQYVLVIVTDALNNAGAVPLISEILTEVHRQMEQIHA